MGECYGPRGGQPGEGSQSVTDFTAAVAPKVAKCTATDTESLAMSPMSRSVDRLRGLAAVVAFSLSTGASGFGAPGQPLRLSPEQRQQMAQKLTPEQRDAFRAARTPEERQRAWQGLSPEQRREFWQGLSPEQRELMMRRVPHEERRQMWERMSPEQREAMRQRFLERRDGAGAHQPGTMRLTPDERQRLRDQIRESQGEWRGSGRAAGPRGGPPTQGR